MPTIQTKIATTLDGGKVTAVFDRVLACALGEATESVRLSVEQMLRDGHQEYVLANQQVLQTLGALPSALPTVVPPAFIKDRVMAQVALTAHDAPSGMMQPELGKFAQTFGAFRRSMVFSGLMLLGGIVVSGYAVDQLIQENVQHPTQQIVSTLSRADGLKAADQITRERDLTTAEVVTAPPAELAASEAPTTQSIQRTSPVETDGYTGHMQTNFGLTQAYLYLTSNPSAMQYSLKPTSAQHAGEGRVLWDETHGDALLVVSKLQATNPGSHYALWYLRDGVAPERMLNFNAASGTPMSFFIKHAPTDRVRGVMVTMEKNVQGRVESQEVLKASIKENLHS